MEYKDYYKILGVGKNADEKEIKKRYRKLARAFHPDRNQGDKSAEEKFKDINEAYEVLGNADNRSKYDQLGANYHRWKQMGGDPNGFDFSQFMNGGGGQAGYGNLNIEDLLGGDFFSQFFGGGRPSAQPLRQDTEQAVEVTLEEAYHGTSRTFVDASGERFTAKIPRGVDTGKRVRLRGKGNRGGDLYLVIQVRPHQTYQRDGDDLRSTVEVDHLTAVLGGQVKVDTLKGPVNLKIMAGTQGGRTMRLRGRGMPNMRDNDRVGNLLVTINISVPTELSAEERELYERLAELQK